MKQYLLKIAFSGVLLTHSIIGMEDVGAQFSGLLEDAEMTSPLAAKAIHQEREFREAVIAQIDDLRGQIEEAQKAPKIEGPDKWKMKVLGQIEKDEAVTIALNARLKELADQKAIVSYPVKFNKISDIIAGVKHLLKSNFSDLLDGCIPTGYAYDQKTVTILGGNNDSTIWGNSRGTFLKTALMYILANKKEGVAGTFGSFGLPWYDRSALAHLTELPENLDLDLASYSFVCSYEEKAKLGLVTPP